MNAYEYLQALRAALTILPDDEIDNAMRYYEDYFLDAGDENASQVISELGTPEQVAQAIVNDYTGVMRRRPPHFDTQKQAQSDPVSGVPLGQNGKPVRKGMNPWVLAVLVLLGLPIGLPILAALVILAVAAVITIAALAFAGIITTVLLAVTPFLAGCALIVVSFLLWATPASALATLGAGLVCTAVGLLLILLLTKLCVLFVPPLVRGFVAMIRWPLMKLSDLIKRGVSK